MGYDVAMSIMEWVVGGFFLLVGVGTFVYTVYVVFDGVREWLERTNGSKRERFS
jgi:hypothetical protein